jgi:hypothetical protein
MVEIRNMYRLMVGNPEGKRSLGRPRLRSAHNIKMDLGEMEWGGVDGNGLAQDKENYRVLANTVMNLRVL